MTKQAYVILGIALIVLVLAGAVLVREKRQGNVEPITPPGTVMSTPSTTQPPTTDMIKDFSEAKKDCKNEQCQKIINEFQEFIDAPLVDTIGWNTYENREHKFSLKYPKEWIFLDNNNPQYGKFVGKGLFILLSPESFERYYVNPPVGITERFPEISVFISKDIDFTKKRYINNLEGGFNVELFILEFKRIKGFISNSPGLREGDVIVSIPYGNILLEFSYDFNNAMNKLEIIKTIINSLVFEN